MIFRQLFDEVSHTYTYLLADPLVGSAILVDPVRELVERDLRLLGELRLDLRYVLETHIHADHVTSASLLRKKTGAKVGIGAKAGVDIADLELEDGDRISVGSLEIRCLATPGHTSGCMSYYVGNQGLVLTGDALLIRGCGRTDFQDGNARQLYESITGRLFSLPEETLVYPAHDYTGHTVSTIGEEKRFNARLTGGPARFERCMGSLGLGRPRMIDLALPANRRLGGG